ncbi:AraC family transcriptional regulator [Variovorax sp. OV084]|jgi:AraC-like DNA-binding protein|uniref:AraC family transcriptional regulator n=1 Tax=Variovorax TaxID=34072 RepID=UPI000B817F52|nr:AraC family transcriptional regulator [Variovorax sp. OV084]
MDPLSEVLFTMRAETVLLAQVEVRGRWAMRFPAYRHFKFGSVLEGNCWLWVEGSHERVHLHEGDCYLLTDGAPYCTASDLSAEPVDGVGLLSQGRCEDGIVRFGFGDTCTRVAGGRFTFPDEPAPLLLSLLPRLVHVPAGAAQTRQLQTVLELIGMETSREMPGKATVATSLSNMVLVQILRAHLESAQENAGWLGALTDKFIGPVLYAMHGDVARRWTLAGLASTAGMSRTAFAERFRRRVGKSPLAYLNGWRMILARAALSHEGQSLSTVAARLGYASDSAFSTAFKKAVGSSPGRFRQDALRPPSEDVLV